jgi:hypothetical protein
MSSKVSIDWSRIYSSLMRASLLIRSVENKLFDRKYPPGKGVKSKMLVMLYRTSAILKRTIEELEKPE